MHGYFQFRENRAGEISDFMAMTELTLVKVEDYFTFEALQSAPEYSIAGSTYLAAPATETFAGKPWEVMEANGLVYNFSTGLVQPIETIASQITIHEGGKFFQSSGLILPGATTDGGQRVKGYAAWFSFEVQRWLYSELNYA